MITLSAYFAGIRTSRARESIRQLGGFPFQLLHIRSTCRVGEHGRQAEARISETL